VPRRLARRDSATIVCELEHQGANYRAGIRNRDLFMSPDANHPATTITDAVKLSVEAVRHWRFAIVLVSSLVVAVGQPLAAELFDEQGTFDVAVSLLIVAVMLLAFEEREFRRIGLLLGLAAFVGLGITQSIPGATNRTFLASSYLLTACFFGFALFGIVRTILTSGVSAHSILGALCGYLLLGIIWSLLYAAVETLAPASFRVASLSGESAPVDRSTLSYYSFVTLSTLGFGDITPATPVARTLSWIEAVAGQFYLAVLVAGLVGFKVAQGPRRAPSNVPQEEGAD
jgi:voltage-gated potassium channel